MRIPSVRTCIAHAIFYTLAVPAFLLQLAAEQRRAFYTAWWVTSGAVRDSKRQWRQQEARRKAMQIKRLGQ